MIAIFSRSFATEGAHDLPSCLDARRAREVPGCNATTDIAEGLRLTYEAARTEVP